MNNKKIITRQDIFDTWNRPDVSMSLRNSWCISTTEVTDDGYTIVIHQDQPIEVLVYYAIHQAAHLIRGETGRDSNPSDIKIPCDVDVVTLSIYLDCDLPAETIENYKFFKNHRKIPAFQKLLDKAK